MSARIYLTQDMDQGEFLDLPVGSVGVFSKCSPEKEHINQDAAGVITLSEHEAVFLIADGLGGSRSGEKAAEIAIECLTACILQGSAQNRETQVSILEGFDLANLKVRELGIGAATTLIVLSVVGRSVRTYHVGDSMALALGRGGKLRYRTVSHAPVSYAVEAGLLDEMEAIHHQERNLVSNVLGSEDMRIEIGAPIELSSNDTVIISSDGLFDNLFTHEIIELSRKGRIEDAMESLVRECHSRMTQVKEKTPSKPDDLTILTFRPR